MRYSVVFLVGLFVTTALLAGGFDLNSSVRVADGEVRTTPSLPIDRCPSGFESPVSVLHWLRSIRAKTHPMQHLRHIVRPG